MSNDRATVDLSELFATKVLAAKGEATTLKATVTEEECDLLREILTHNLPVRLGSQTIFSIIDRSYITLDSGAFRVEVKFYSLGQQDHLEYEFQTIGDGYERRYIPERDA